MPIHIHAREMLQVHISMCMKFAISIFMSFFFLALTSTYTSIKQGDNRITARNECVNDPASKGFSSVNVTGANQ